LASGAIGCNRVENEGSGCAVHRVRAKVAGILWPSLASVGQRINCTLAAGRYGYQIDPDRELIAFGGGRHPAFRVRILHNSPGSQSHNQPFVKGEAMRSCSDFWLTLHKLASDLIKVGSTDAERAENICRVLNAISPATRGAYLENLDAVVSSLGPIAKECKG
jgi:hypothetical protein